MSAKPHTLEKTLGLLDVYAITTAGFFSAGFFVLPALAFEVGGPAAVFAYPIAALLMVPSMLCLAELATALPRAGGPYFFLDRSLGPAVGTIGGIGTWLALVLKSCFAFIGLGAYLAVMPYVGGLLPADPTARAWVIKGLAVGLTAGFAFLNVAGAKETTTLQNYLVMGLAVVLGLFIANGVVFLFGDAGRPLVEQRFDAWLDQEHGVMGGVAAVGLVFFTSIGIIKLVSVSEEIASPGRNIPLGIGLSILTATVVNTVGVFIMIAAVKPETLAHSYTPAYDAAETFFEWIPQPAGLILVALAAMAAFAASGNAGILGASRYPLAMSRDGLIGKWFGKVSKSGTPVTAIVATAAVMAVFILAFDAKSVAKLASAFVLVVFALMNLAIIVMRESKIESYDPQFRTPLYPWMPIAGIAISVYLITEMGALSLLFSLGVVVCAALWYAYYGHKNAERHGALFHWFALLGKYQHDELEDEFRQIMVEKGARADDPFDDVVTRAHILDVDDDTSYHGLIAKASESLAKRLPRTAEFITEKFIESGRFGFAPMAHGAVLPHFRSTDIALPELVIVRSRKGVQAALTEDEKTSTSGIVHAVFLLVSPEDDPGIHLRILAHLAGRLEKGDFMPAWLAAEDEQQLKEILLRDDRHFSLQIEPAGPTSALINQPLHKIPMPEDTLVAMVRRRGRVFIPRGGTVLRLDDRLTILGDPKGITKLQTIYGLRPAPPTEDPTDDADANAGDHDTNAGSNAGNAPPPTPRD